MAGIRCAAHTSASSSGTEAPSRKLNAERVWSSMYMVSRSWRPRTNARSRDRGKCDKAPRHCRFHWPAPHPTLRGPKGAPDLCLRFLPLHFPPTNHQTSAMVLPTTKSCPAALRDRFVSPRPSDSQAVHLLSAPEAGAQDDKSAAPAAFVPRYLTLWDAVSAWILLVRP